jgi:class 3 adenylate cyclase
MLPVSFRTKLLLAMMFVVAGVTIVMLLIAQKRVQANYERMFRTQYEWQVGYFTALQEERLAAIKEQCVALVKSVRLLAILREDEVDTNRLYDIAGAELRPVLRELPDDGHPSRGRAATFYRFLDVKGNVIVGPENAGAKLLPPSVKRQLEQRLGLVREALKSDEVQNVAYMPLTFPASQSGVNRPGALRARVVGKKNNNPSETEAPTLQEIIVTRIADPNDGKYIGALILGFPLPDLVPELKKGKATNSMEVIQAGILIEERLFANPAVISEKLGDLVANQIAKQIKEGVRKQGDLVVDFERTPYRVHYEILNESSKFPASYQVCLYSLAEAQAEQRALRWKVLGLGGGAILVALAISLFLAHGLSAPVRSLVVGTGEIGRGNYQVRVPVKSRDELGQLANSFNEMAEGLAQKEKYRTVLSMVADKKVARKLMEEDIKLGGELREATVLFCDIRGFTALTENMPPGEVIELINEHMTALTQIVQQHDGVLDKFVGDLLMAVFGVPFTHGDDTGNAVRCAIDLIRAREKMNLTSRYRIRIGVGLATGTVVAGYMGSDERLNYTVLGERVNLASRLCGRAVAGEILIDENTRGRLGPQFTVEPTGDVELKGFASPVAAYRLATLTPQPPASV